MSFTLGNVFDTFVANPSEKLWEGAGALYRGAEESAGNVKDYISREMEIQDMEKRLREGDGGILSGGSRKRFDVADKRGKVEQDFLDQVGESYATEEAARAAYKEAMEGEEGNIAKQLAAKRLDPATETQLDSDLKSLDEIAELQIQQSLQEEDWKKTLAALGQLSELTGDKKKASPIKVSSQTLSGAGRLGTGLSFKDILNSHVV